VRQKSALVVIPFLPCKHRTLEYVAERGNYLESGAWTGEDALPDSDAQIKFADAKRDAHHRPKNRELELTILN
jgi:hypothetical protein